VIEIGLYSKHEVQHVCERGGEVFLCYVGSLSYMTTINCYFL